MKSINFISACFALFVIEQALGQAGLQCKANGAREEGMCDTRKPANELDSCLNCKRGYVRPPGNLNDWCCTKADLENDGRDCKCFENVCKQTEWDTLPSDCKCEGKDCKAGDICNPRGICIDMSGGIHEEELETGIAASRECGDCKYCKFFMSNNRVTCRHFWKTDCESMTEKHPKIVDATIYCGAMPSKIFLKSVNSALKEALKAALN